MSEKMQMRGCQAKEETEEGNMKRLTIGTVGGKTEEQNKADNERSVAAGGARDKMAAHET